MIQGAGNASERTDGTTNRLERHLRLFSGKFVSLAPRWENASLDQGSSSGIAQSFLLWLYKGSHPSRLATNEGIGNERDGYSSLQKPLC